KEEKPALISNLNIKPTLEKPSELKEKPTEKKLIEKNEEVKIPTIGKEIQLEEKEKKEELIKQKEPFKVKKIL
ncbi:MAG TPA: hypothetical protein PLY02_02420, partial [Candidatus Pacearchaeota archaeon]|nr:hypothetical protein [Candidatus Pacearchaeota archaeon]